MNRRKSHFVGNFQGRKLLILLTSLDYSLKNGSLFLCLYINHLKTAFDNNSISSATLGDYYVK